ncbi:hypothetical protein ACFL4J_01465 [Candidatus Margulisiibacteriota bacterium]
MRGYLICLIIASLIGTPFCRAAFAENVDWDKQVAIGHETTIAPANLVRVKPGTKINISGTRGKLIIQGQLSVQGSQADPVTITIPNLLYGARPVSFKDQTVIRTNQDLKELEIHPYSVETEEIVDELEAFRKQYAFVWVVLMGIQIYLVLNRSTYW